VAKTVAHVELRDHLVEVIFTLFDENREFGLKLRSFIIQFNDDFNGNFFF